MLCGRGDPMDPVKFGLFLKEERGKKNMTQAQLADALHVTPAAVSKWERGKCLPDLAKLEELAGLLGLSILELLHCKRAEAAPPEEQLQVQVYRETLQTERQLQGEKRRKARHRFLAALAALLLTGLLLYQFPLYYALYAWQPSYFETGEIGLLLSRGNLRDRRLARETMDLAEEAFSTMGISREEAEARFGVLARFCTTADYYPSAASEEHSLRLWTAHFPREGGSVDGNRSGSAYLWVCYWQRAADVEGKLVRGSGTKSEPIVSLWRLEEQPDGTWKVVGIREHP